MFRDRKSVTSEIQRLFHSEYEIEITKEAYALTQFAFHYKTMSNSSDIIKLEINFLRRVPIREPKIRSFKHFDYNIDFLCLDYQELLASKIIALLSRYTPRDLFDVYQMAISPLELTRNIFRSLLLFYGIIPSGKIFDLFKLKFELITQSDIQNKLAPMLRKGIYPNRDELVAKIEKFLSPFLALTKKETDMLHNFYNTDNLDFNILFPQKYIQERVQISQSLKWKIQNIRRSFE